MKHPPQKASTRPYAQPVPTSSRRAIAMAPTKLAQPAVSASDKSKGRTLTKEEIAEAAKKGKRIVAYAPSDLFALAGGHKTLGEIEGISKKEQYRMAQVGWRFLSEGKLDKGMQVFFGLVALDPYDAYFFTCLASAHQQKGDKRTAEELYTRALSINPYATTARAHRGELRAMDGRLQDAVADLSRAVHDDPKLTDPAVQRAAVLLRLIGAQLKAA